MEPNAHLLTSWLIWQADLFILFLWCREAGMREGERIRQQALEEVEQLKQKVMLPLVSRLRTMQ